MAREPRDPSLITQASVKFAARQWHKKPKFLNFGPSLWYDVIIDGKPYPPKVIVSLAYQKVTGTPLQPSEFVGASTGQWHRRLWELGFEIVQKSDRNFEDLVRRGLKMNQEKRLKAIKRKAEVPVSPTTVTVTRFPRDPNVVAERLFLAGGYCEKCKNPAPFKRSKDGSPFLEVHHIQLLSKGGLDSVENTTALCPNCHSEVHDLFRYGRDDD